MNAPDLHSIALEAARAAAHAISASAAQDLAVDAKQGPHDLVTNADRSAENAAIATIRHYRPDDAVLAEEPGNHAGTTDVLWLVDPLDGTTNFVYGRGEYAISIAAQSGAGDASAIVRPADGTWAATTAEGTAGTRSLVGTEQTRLSHALVSVGFPHERYNRVSAASVLQTLLPHIRDFRRIGSAACELLAVATGTLDAYVGCDIQPWDYAAGHTLVLASGGHVTELRRLGMHLTIAAATCELTTAIANALAPLTT